MHKSKLTVLLLCCVFLISCTSYGVYKEAGKLAATAAADEALKVKLWSLCNATSYGAVKRWVGSDENLADALKTICKQVKQADVETDSIE